MSVNLINTLNDIISYTTTSLGTNLFTKAADLINGITPLITAALGTYFLLCLLDYYRNGVMDNIIDMTKKFTGWVLLSALVLNAANYADIAKLVYEAPDKFAAVVGNAQSFDGNLFKSMMTSADTIVAKIDEYLAKNYWFELTENIPAFSTKFTIYLGLSIVSGICIIYYLIAKVCLALILLIDPLFLGGMFFPSTRQYGMNWIGQAFNYIVSIMLYVASNKLMITFLTNQMSRMAGVKELDVPMLLEINMIMFPLTILFVLVIFSIPSIASALTGGAVLEMNARKGGIIGKPFWSATKGAGKWAYKKLGGASNSMKSN